MRGHCAYYAVPGNSQVRAFRDQAARHWYRALRRRSHRTRLNWERMNHLVTWWLPPARIMHPWPSVRFDARERLCPGAPGMHGTFAGGHGWALHQDGSFLPPEPRLMTSTAAAATHCGTAPGRA